MTKYKGALGAYIVCIILGVIAEMAKFLKWYIVVRKRVTNNSLGVIIKEDLQNPKERVEDSGLEINEKFTVIFLFVVNRTIQLILAVQIMISYDFLILLSCCIGLAAGNFMFSGLFGDQFVISKIKRQIRLNRLTTDKINKHNAIIKAHCLNGDKNLITSSLEKTMSL